MYRSRRALPRASRGIGTFNTVFDLMTRLSVVTNAGLLVLKKPASRLSRRRRPTRPA